MQLSERIKLIRIRSGLSQEAFAQSVGLKRANYAQIEAGNQNPTLIVLTEIVRNYSISYEWLLEGTTLPKITAPIIAPTVAPNQNGADLQLVPKVVAVSPSGQEMVPLVPLKAAAGYLNGYADPEYIEKLPTIEIPGVSGQTHRAFEVRGSSMLPLHHPGSISIGRWVESLDEIKDRRVYILLTKHDGIVLKRVLNRIETDGKLILMSDNDNKREYPNYPVDVSEILEIWYWRASIIRESPEPGTFYTRLNDLDGRLTLLENRLKNK